MAGYSSIKDLTKALHSFFATPTSPDPCQGSYTTKDLTQELNKSIQSFVAKSSILDEADNDRLLEDLLHIHQKHVVQDKAKLAAFLLSLRLLRPLLHGQARFIKLWETAVAPVVDGTGHKTVEINRATEFLLSILDYNPDEDDADSNLAKISGQFSQILLDAYLKRSRVLKPKLEQLTLDDTIIARQLEDILISFGRKKPKDFLIAVDRLLVDTNNRMQALSLLSAYVRYQPPHLHLVVETPLIEHLLKCLMIDTSTTVISLALSCLIMFLPHIPSSVKAHLPRLFLIYSRILCWERYPPASTIESETTGEHKVEPSSPDSSKSSPTNDEDWAKLSSSFDKAESTAPELLHYFTFLYGLYPRNFTNYIRKPRRYLKDINFPRAEDFDLDQAVIRARSEQFRRVHLMHPNFFNTTAHDELTDNRWLKSDPADVVSECMSLCVAPPPDHAQSELGTATASTLSDIPPHLVHTDDIPSQSLLDKDENTSVLNTVVENEQSDHLVSTAEVVEPSRKPPGRVGTTPSTQSPATTSPSTHPLDSPTIPTPKFVVTSSRDNLPQRKDSGSSFPSTLNQSPHINAVFSRSQMPRSPAVRPSSHTEANMTFLQREIMLLRSDLNFERYLKQQHLTHIGQLQRRHIREATMEAETQNLINTNRSLKAQLVKANDAYTALKKEATTGRNQAKKLEAELSTRVKNLREDEKKWRAEEEALRVDLSKARQDCDHLRQLIVDSEARELLALQELSFAQVKLEQVHKLQCRIAEMEESIRGYEAEELKYVSAEAEKADLQQELAIAKLLAQNQDANLDLARGEFNARVGELEARLRAAQASERGEESGEGTSHVQMLIVEAVAAVDSKYSALKKEHAALRERYMDLELKHQQVAQPVSGNGLRNGEQVPNSLSHIASTSFLAGENEMLLP